jgi:plastocyanin
MRKLAILLTATMAVVLGLAVGSASGERETVKAKNYEFDSKTVTVQKGDKVTWKSTQGKHSVTLNNGAFNKVIRNGDSVSRKFGQRGTFRYYCRFHKDLGMRGKVIVQ